ncbi:phage tail tape measure protein [Escherichia coli]|nr:phage tail tape measure protein [Escherichia coli]
MKTPTIPTLLGPDGMTSLREYAGYHGGGSGFGGQLRAWNPPGESVDAALLPNFTRGNARADDLVRNNGYAANAIQLHQDHIVGSFFRLSHRPSWRYLGIGEEEARAFSREVEAAWKEFAEDDCCCIDVERKRTFTMMIREGVAMHAFNGELFVQATWDTSSSRLFRTQFRMVSPKRISNPNNTGDSRNCRAGVQINDSGAALGYYVSEDGYPGWMPQKWTWIPRELPGGRASFIHVFEPVEDGQTRGANVFYSVMEQMKMLDTLQNTQLQSAIVKAMYAATIESELDTQSAMDFILGANSKEQRDRLTGWIGEIAAYYAAAPVRLGGAKVPHLMPGAAAMAISVGQYKAAMRMLPAQFTDVATQLAGGQSPWLILLQQGGQVKDSFGGMIPMFRGLAGAITLPMVGATSLAVATGALAYAWYQGNSTLSDFNKTLVLSGNQAGLTADRMLVLSRAGQAAGLTFNQTSESLTALVNAGVRGGEQFEAISQSVARFSSASGVEVDKVAEAFGKLTTDPTSGLTAMARQFHNVTAEQIAYVAQLQRSGDEAGALQAANEAATKGFDDQTLRLKENMGTLETWADRTARAFKSMWDAVLDIGRPDTAQGMLEKAEKAFDEADKKWQWYQSRSHRRGKTSAFLANLRGAWEDRANAQLGLSAATLQADLEKAREMAAKDWAESEASRLKYTEEAQKAYERLQTPLEKYTARQEELNKALKDGKILQADYNTLMAAAKKDYEATLKKPKQSAAGERQEDRAHAALLALQAELKMLEQHSGANEKISQQRRDLWKAESQFAVLEEAAQRRQLSAQEKSLLAHKDETLEYKRQLAALGDKVTYQEHLNALAQQADKFAQQQRAKRAAIDAKNRGLTDRQAAREATEQRLKEQYGDNPLALNNVMSEQKKTWAAEDQLRGSWMAGLRSGWSEWKESATDSMSQVKSAATQTFDGIAQNMAAMLTGSEQNWRSFTRSVLSMMTEILLKQAMVGIVGSIGSAIGGAAGGGASVSGGTAIQAAAAKFHFATGGFTGTGGKYEPAGIVHRGEFVFTKEATSRIGVGNLYRLMRGYAEGGYVGGAGSPAQMRRAEGINFNQNNHVVIQNDGTNGLPGPQMMKAVYDMARKGARDEIQAQMRDGGLFSGGGR